MSRAFDPETAASLKDSNHETFYKTVYNDIVKALSTETDSLLEIEFLGSSHLLRDGCNVLVDGHSVAISKSKLVQAFIFARNIFFRHLRDCPEEKSLDFRNATAVMLLMDPEHLTAANARKRLIQKAQRDPKANLEQVLKSELHLVDSYLTSRLHRHTKSPTLWGHRRWVLDVCKSSQMEYDIRHDIKTVVLVAAERHPRNYYAWSHLRWLVQSFNTCSGNPMTSSDFDKLVFLAKDWCLRHPADISGFSFILFCFSIPGNFGEVSKAQLRSSICSDVLRLAVSFQWTHETIWVFLRTLVASGGAYDAENLAFFRAIEDIQAVHPDGHRFLEATQNWCRQYATKGIHLT